MIGKRGCHIIQSELLFEGPVGATGPAGSAGLKGNTGSKGNPGTSGTPGQNGAQGQPGAVGPQGPQGLQGPQGQPGNVGPSGNSGPNGNPGFQGLSGLFYARSVISALFVLFYFCRWLTIGLSANSLIDWRTDKSFIYNQFISHTCIHYYNSRFTRIIT